MKLTDEEINDILSAENNNTERRSISDSAILDIIDEVGKDDPTKQRSLQSPVL